MHMHSTFESIVFFMYAVLFVFLMTFTHSYYSSHSNHSTQSSHTFSSNISKPYGEGAPFWLWVDHMSFRMDTTGEIHDTINTSIIDDGLEKWIDVYGNMTIRFSHRFYVGRASFKMFKSIFQTTTCKNPTYNFLTLSPRTFCFETNQTIYKGSIWK